MSRPDEPKNGNSVFDEDDRSARGWTRMSRRQFALTGLCAGKVLLALDALLAGVNAKPIGSSASKSGASTTFASIKRIDAGLLNVGYAEAGPADGRPIILLHSWPYKIDSFADVTPLLAAAGHRVIVPYIRGFGTTRFLQCHVSERSTIGGGTRHDCTHGCASHPEGNPGWLRLGSADG